MRFRVFARHSGMPLILPTLVVMSLFTVLPLLEGFRLSFTNANLLNPGSTYVGLANYAALMHDPVFWLALLHSLILTVAAVALQLALGVLLALILKQDLPGIRLLRSIIMASWVIPVAATAVMFTFMVQPTYGYVNIVLRLLGLKRFNLFWFGNLAAALPFMVLLHLWRNVPFYGIALLAAMQAVPRERYEAAEIAGAGPLMSFLYVTVPGIRSMVMVMVTIHVLWTFNNFDMVFLTTGGGPVYATEVLPVYLYQKAWTSYTTGYAASIGSVMFILLMIYFMAYISLYERAQR